MHQGEAGADRSELLYQFPPKCSLPREPVSWCRLAFGDRVAVACICLWGTLIGSMLPILFKRIGRRPRHCLQPLRGHLC